jgi:hypothetical protein
MTHPIIKTENYLLVVDDSEIKQSDWICNEEREPYIVKCIGKGSLRGWAKITYHLPLNNAPILEGVPLLPPLEDEAEKLAKKHGSSIWDKRGRCVFDFMRYKYTEEDLRKAWNAAYIDALSLDEETYKPLFFEDFIQSIQQPKYPVAFECEMEYKDMVGYWYKVDEITKEAVNRFDLETRPKTITNSQGLTQLVGKYIY